MSALVGWTLFAFGGVYFWAATITACAAILLLLTSRCCFLEASGLRPLDGALAVAFTVACLHILPMPASVVNVLSPNREAIASAVSLAREPALRPLSLNTASSIHALMVFGSAIAVFWAARGIFTYAGLRTVTRTVAALGLVASVVGVLQDASRTRLVYWWWAPETEGAPVFGPFINRNHAAAWIVMALSLTVGYVAARTQGPDGLDRFRSFFARLRRRLDGRTLWLVLAVGSMSVGLAVTLSRSGLAAAVAAVVAARILAAGRQRPARASLTVLVVSIAAIAILWTGPSTLAERWMATEIGQRGRIAIWRDTAPVVKDFWLTGTGVGTYGDAMTSYQRVDRDRVHFNQAHNHYLHVLAEGGLLLLLPLAAAALAFLRAARARIDADRTGMLWLRVGAAAGLGGLAVSSIWETAARMPANAVLAAVLAAIVLHDTHHHRAAGEAHPWP